MVTPRELVFSTIGGYRLKEKPTILGSVGAFPRSKVINIELLTFPATAQVCG